MTHSTLTLLKNKDVVGLLTPLYEMCRASEEELYGVIFQMTELRHRQILVYMWQQQLGLTTDLERLIRKFGGHPDLVVDVRPIASNPEADSSSVSVMECVNQLQALQYAYAHALKNELPQNARMVVSAHVHHVQTIIHRLHTLQTDLNVSTINHLTMASSGTNYRDFLPHAM